MTESVTPEQLVKEIKELGERIQADLKFIDNFLKEHTQSAKEAD